MLQVEGLSKNYQGLAILDKASFEVPKGRCLSILGKSGSGKTTLLKCIAGLVEPDSGKVVFNDLDLTRLPSRERGIVYLFQEPLLFPYLNVFENLAFGLKIRKRPKPEINKRVTEMLAALNMAEMALKRPEQLSGGQKQRVNFGRALIVRPRALLLDEPFGALDAATRKEMQNLFIRTQRDFGITALFVTHDAREALLVGGSYAIMDRHRLNILSDQEAFIKDRRSGLQDEIEFWATLNKQNGKSGAI